MAFVGDTPELRQRYANAPLAALGRNASGDALLDFMRDIVRSQVQSPIRKSASNTGTF